jgi:hypothetical protein
MVIEEPGQEPAYDWMHPIKMFLENQPPSDDNAEVERIARKSKQYHLIDGITRHQWHDDEVHIKGRGNLATPRHL